MKFRHAITRAPCRALVRGITTAHLGAPDYQQAVGQHAGYVTALQSCGVEVVVLPPLEEFPDSVFVEDVALCVPGCAVVTRPGVESRRDEPGRLEHELRSRYQCIERIEAPGTLEGGDVMMAGTHCYIGLSARTNADGARQLVEILERHGMTGSIVDTGEVVHLKTGLAYLEGGHLLAIAAFQRHREFEVFNIIDVPADETYAANCIWVNDSVLMPDGFPRTRERIEACGYEVIALDTSEFRKLDGGVSCLSLRF